MDYLIKHLKSVDSTNNFVQELFKTASPEEGLVIWADEQTKGRGHAANKWEGKKCNNLTFTLLLRPEFVSPSDQFVLTQMVSVAIRKLIVNYIPDEAVKIKWPNDIYIEHSKVAGILIQNALKGNKIDYSIIGVGLNVNQLAFSSDAPNPVSLKHYLGTDLSIEDLLSKLLVEIDAIYTNLGSSKYCESLNNRYLNNMYRYRKSGLFLEGKKEFTATIEGIGEYGRLMLKLDTGKIQLYDFKEIEFVI